MKMKNSGNSTFVSIIVEIQKIRSQEFQPTVDNHYLIRSFSIGPFRQKQLHHCRLSIKGGFHQGSVSILQDSRRGDIKLVRYLVSDIHNKKKIMTLANIRKSCLDENEEFRKQHIMTNESFGILNICLSILQNKTRNRKNIDNEEK